MTRFGTVWLGLPWLAKAWLGAAEGNRPSAVDGRSARTARTARAARICTFREQRRLPAGGRAVSWKRVATLCDACVLARMLSSSAAAAT